MTTRHVRIELHPAEPGCPPLSLMSSGSYCTEHDATVERPEGCPRLAKPSARPHYLRLVAANGQVLAHSEAYASRSKARRAVTTWIRAFGEVWHGVATFREPLAHEFDANGERTR